MFDDTENTKRRESNGRLAPSSGTFYIEIDFSIASTGWRRIHVRRRNFINSFFSEYRLKNYVQRCQEYEEMRAINRLMSSSGTFIPRYFSVASSRRK